MPYTLSPAADARPSPSTRRARIEQLDRLSKRLDTSFRVPGLGLRFGWDAILGLIPGVGDVVTTIPSLMMIYEGHRIGARKRVLAWMGLNTGVDFLLGSVPVLGDAFDVFFKSHRRNIALLKQELEHIERTETRRNA